MRTRTGRTEVSYNKTAPPKKPLNPRNSANKQEELCEKNVKSKDFAKVIYNLFRIERKKLSATNAFFEYKKIFIVALQSGNTLYFESKM